MGSAEALMQGRQTIEAALPAWIRSRPWSHGARVQSAHVVALLPIPGYDDARVAIVEDEKRRAYAVPLAVVSESDAAIAKLPDGVAVDALAVPAVGEALVAAARAGGTTTDANHTLRFHAQRGTTAERWVAKVIHKLEPGESPELEVVRFLGAAGYRYVAPLAGWVDLVHEDAPPSTVAVIEGYVPRRGTALAQLDEEIDRWFGEILQMGDVDAPKLPPNDILSRALFPLPEDITVAVGDYLRDAALLGTRVGEMHKLLASTSVDAFAPSLLDLAAREKLANEAKRAVGDAFAVLDVRGPSLPAAMVSQVTSLRAKLPSIEKRLMGLLSAPEGAMRIRTHGDLRLERILFTDDDYLIDGFEGDVTQPLAERKRKRSPLDDVASMLRSYHHGVARALARQPAARRPKLAPWAALYHRAASASFLGGWLRAASESSVLPAAPAATRALLDAFLIDRCAREMQSEDELDVEVGLEGLREVLETERKPGQMRTSRSFSPFVQSLRAVKVEPPTLDASSPELHAFKTGTSTHAHRLLGAHRRSDGALDVAVWAPNAVQVAIVGDFNDWSSEAGVLTALGDTGVYAGRVRGARVGQRYMFRIPGADEAPPRDKADPFGRAAEQGRRHASIITGADYAWGDQKWMQARRAQRGEDRPISVLDVEIDAGYRDLALPVAARAKQLGFTHVALRFAYDGFFAPSSHYGSTEDLMFLVDTLHQDGIGVFFAWSPAEFALDEPGLVEFDGTPTFESDDAAAATHPVSGMGLFDMAKPEVQSFLLSSAVFWVEELHADGLRFDNLAAAVYRDDRRAPGTWSPNAKGGRENLEGVELLLRMTKVVKTTYPGVHLVAGDGTAWPNVTASAELGGLGFDLRGEATFVDDLRFHLALDAKVRPNHDLSPAESRSHVVTTVDEAAATELDVVARRIWLALAWAQPGKKLLVPADDDETTPLVADLNRIYTQTLALHGDVIETIPASVPDVLIFRRRHAGSELLAVANLGPSDVTDAAVASAAPGTWKIVLDTRGEGEMRVVETAALSIPARTVLFLVAA